MPRPFNNRWKRFRLASLVVLSSVFAVSCGGGGGDGDVEDNGGGVIGTGLQLDGTVPTNRALAESTIEIKARSGERSSATIASNGRFTVDGVQGEGPYLLRVNLGNGIFYYGISHAIDAASATQNVHAYSDIVIRNWFAQNNLDIDASFNIVGPLSNLPTQSDVAAISSALTALVEPALDAYGLGEVDLQTVEFSADDTGVDQFLDQNPVNLNDDTITIVITEPETGTATTVTNNLSISTDFTAVDSVAPSAPVAIRALASASNEIVIAWETAGDNVAVVNFEIIRDGVAVAESPFPVFIDTGLQSGIVYEYAIVAIDADGNRSAASEVAESSTLAAPDNVPPPSPTSVELLAGTSSINVSWTQSEIGDVASFTLLRSEAGSMLDTLVRVTTTEFDDIGLNSGTEYCYQVIASDASENDSPASDLVCTSTSGTSLSTAPPVTVMPTPQPTPTPAPTPTPTPAGDFENLLAVDVTAVSCTEELRTADVDGTVTIPAGCYSIPSSLRLGDDDFLTLEPGVIFKFGASTDFVVGDGASLTANGTLANPIVLSGEQPTAGFWRGLEFNFSNNLNNQLENVVIEYAGAGSSDSDSALEINANTSFVSRVSANRVLLRNSQNDGFTIDNGAILERFDSIISTSNNRSGLITPELASSIGATSQLTGNTIDAIALSNTDVDVASTLPNLGVPWLVDRLDVDAPLEIAAGNTLIFESLGSVDVSASGSLRAVGTAAQPIVFTSGQMTPGFWSGVTFAFSPSVNNVLDHIVIEFAGSGSPAQASALRVSANTSNPTRLSVSNAVLRNSRGSGFVLPAGLILEGFSSITSTGNDQSGRVSTDVVSGLGMGLELQGNTLDQIELFDRDINRAQIWPALNVPYLFDQVDVDSTLTLSPGSVFIGVSGASFNVSQDGSLNAVGTAIAPITFSGSQSTPGFWDGIAFAFSDSTQNVLEHVTISDAGGGGAPNSRGAIALNCNVSFSSRLSLSNMTVSNGISWGLFSAATGCIIDVGPNVNLVDNALGDFNLQ